jgi:DNA processing protein
MPEITTPTTADLLVGEPYHELSAIIALIRSGVVSGTHLGSLIDEVGSAVRLVQLSESDRLFAAADASHDVIGAVTDQDIAKAFADAVAWVDRGLDVRTVLSAKYPNELHEIFNRPPLLFVQGKWLSGASRWVCVVGTRKPTRDGVLRAQKLTSELVMAGFSILSGLARGIDTVAHTAALDAGGTTSAVIGTGLERVYPSENTHLAERITDTGGALLSQFFPSQPPARWTFPMRNVVMSGLSLATVVIEASETSGARMQARVAMQHGRTVFLLRSLVHTHEWARRYVQQGAYGTKAVEIASVEEIVERVAPVPASHELAVA